MLSPQELKRYNRHIILPEIGLKGQLALKSAKVLIIGMGGLGCPVAQYLAAAGVGAIGMVEFDIVDISNLQRQILYQPGDIGKLKVEVAASRINALNPDVTVNAFPLKCAPDTILDIVKKYEVVVDCTDNYAARYLINDACVTLDKPLVSASVFRFESQLSVYNYNGGPTYRCLFPEPPEETLNCAEAGVVGILTGIVGTMQANEVLKVLTGAGEVLSGKLFLYNALSGQTNILKFRRDEEQVRKIKALNGDLRKMDYEVLCNTGLSVVPDISATSLKEKLTHGEIIQLIDVREDIEHELENIGGEQVSLYDIPNYLDRIETDKPVVFYCATGVRSAAAIQELLKLKKFDNLLNLKGGLKAWNELL